MVDPNWIFEQQILDTLAKPGHQWTAAERQLVIGWLFTATRLKLLLTSVLSRYSAFGYNLEDIEDAWSDFCVTDIYSVIKTYNPTHDGAAPFLEWVKFCFKRSCLRRIRRIKGKESISIEDLILESSSGEDWESRLFSLGHSRDRGPLKNFEVKELNKRIRNCLSRMPPLYRRMLVLKDVEGYSTAEIASTLGKTDGYVKGTLFRARRLFRELFEGRSLDNDKG